MEITHFVCLSGALGVLDFASSLFSASVLLLNLVPFTGFPPSIYSRPNITAVDTVSCTSTLRSSTFTGANAGAGIDGGRCITESVRPVFAHVFSKSVSHFGVLSSYSNENKMPK